jgi:hypothetical protein
VRGIDPIALVRASTIFGCERKLSSVMAGSHPPTLLVGRSGDGRDIALFQG